MTKDEIIEMARQAGLIGKPTYVEGLEAFAKLVAQHEREKCAKVCEDLSKDMTPIAKQAVKTCATFVRSRKS